MMPQIYEAIEKAIADGVRPQYLAGMLIYKGYPSAVVNQAVNAWLQSHGRLQQKTDFKDWLKKYKGKAFGSMIIIVIIGVICSSITLLKPWPTKIMVDSAFGNIPAPGSLKPYTHTAELILITSLMTLVIFLVGAFFEVVRDFTVLKLGFKLNRGIKSESFRHILHLPLYHQERLAKGDYIYRQNILTNSLSDLVLDTTSEIAQSVIMILGILVIMLKFNAKLTLISVIVIPFLFLLIKIFGPLLGKLATALTQITSDTSAAITEAVDNAETVQSFNLEGKQLAKANNLWQQAYKVNRKGLLLSHLYRSSNSLLIILGTSAVMYLGGTAALHQEMTLGQLLIFMTYMGYLLEPVETLAAEIAARNQKIIDVSRVYEVLSDHEGIEDLRKEAHLPISRGRIEFQNVSYTYNDTQVLNSVNLIVEAGQKVGVIGPSGGGKSTLLKLLPLFIEPDQGRILIDNIDTQTVSLRELRQNVAWISQTPQLFNETILENLLDGDVHRPVSEQELERAITVANVKEFTDRLPMGLQTTAGEGGNSLSGGQRQRVAIARGLIKNAPVICMDEPTAALDSKSENFIRDSIAQLIENKTVMMVTHRKALLDRMDVIYVMEDGQLINVDELGGLTAYLHKINNTEAENFKEAEIRRQMQVEEQEKLTAEHQRLAALEAENYRLQQIARGEQPATEGSIYIEH